MLPGSAAQKTIGNLLVLALVALAVGGAWFALHVSVDPTSIRPGWSILRPPDDVNALVFHRGVIVAGGRDGLSAFDPATAARVALPDWGAVPPPEVTHVKALLVDRAGRLWVGHRNGVLRLEGRTRVAFATDPGTAPGPVTALMERASGDILVGGEVGLAMVSGDHLSTIDLPPTNAGGAVSALHEDRLGRLWVGFASASRGGLLLHDGGLWRSFDRTDGLVHLSVNAITEDHAGRIHLATGYSSRGGACRQIASDATSGWICLGAANGLASDMVRLVFEDRHGQFWYGSEFDGSAVARGGGIRRFGRADGQAGTELKAILEDPAGNIWLGCDKGLTRIDASASLIE